MTEKIESIRDMVFHAMDKLSQEHIDWSDQQIAEHLMLRRKFKATSMLEAKVLLVPIRQWREMKGK